MAETGLKVRIFSKNAALKSRHWKTKKGSFIPIGSMELVYLPTWMVYFYGKCIGTSYRIEVFMFKKREIYSLAPWENISAVKHVFWLQKGIYCILLLYFSIVDDLVLCAWWCGNQSFSIGRFYKTLPGSLGREWWTISSNLDFHLDVFQRFAPLFFDGSASPEVGWILDDSYSQLNGFSWTWSSLCFFYQRSSDQISTVSHLILLEKRAAKVC